MGLAVYKMTGTNDIDGSRSNRRTSGQFVSAMSWLGGAAGYLPERRPDIQRIVDRISNVNSVPDSINGLNKEGDRERARVTIELNSIRRWWSPHRDHPA